MTTRYAWRGVFALLLLIVTFLTLTPDPAKTPSGFAIARLIAQWMFADPALADKVGHFLAYAALGLTASFADFRLRGRRLFAMLAIAAYGAALEFAQGAGGVRNGDVIDAFANTSGALSAFLAFALTERALSRARPA
jgi:hypothetical protein